MLEFEVLIREFASVDTLSTCSIEVCEVTTLHHETFNHTMENAIFEGKHLARFRASTSLTSTKLTEVLSCTRHNIFEEFHDNSTGSLTVDLNVEENSRV